MSVTVQNDGYFEVTYNGPWGGLHVQAPANLIDDRFSPFTRNWMFRNAELRTAPVFSLEYLTPDQGNQPLGQTSFLDTNEIWHTVCFTARGLWQLGPIAQVVGPFASWSPLGGPAFTEINPVSSQAFAGVLYYTNGSPFLASWDGIADAPTASVATISKANTPTVSGGLPGAPAMVGPMSIGGQYVSELDNHILLVNVSILDEGTGTVYQFPNLMWWSADGLPDVWDPTVNTNAGFNVFLDVPDQITGIFTVGTSGYLIRSNGVTYFNPTGNGLIPFQFDHLWASKKGIGNVYPWSASSYGSFSCFISTEQIYQMSVFSFTEIGGGARDSIMADLAQSTGSAIGCIVPVLTLGYVYLCYVIAIPLSGFTRTYWYSFEDKNWSVWDVGGLICTGKPEAVWTGITAGNTFIPGLFPPATGQGSQTGSGGGSDSGGGPGKPTGGPFVL